MSKKNQWSNEFFVTSKVVKQKRRKEYDSATVTHCKTCGASVNVRHCKTCGVVVGKGKSYCRNECKPSWKKRNFQRKCKECGVDVGASKSYCPTCKIIVKKRKSEIWRQKPEVKERRKRYLQELRKKQSPEKKRAKREYQRNWARNNKDVLEAYKEKCRKENVEKAKKEKLYCCDCKKYMGTKYDLRYDKKKKRLRPFNPKFFRCSECKRLNRNRMMREYRKKEGNRLARDVRTRVWQTLRGGKKHDSTFTALGYTVDELKEHLESLWEPGMTWDNYNRYGWHIDHIIPISEFKFKSTKDQQFKECWKLSNLQPLWAQDNWDKNNRLDWKKNEEKA